MTFLFKTSTHASRVPVRDFRRGCHAVDVTIREGEQGRKKVLNAVLEAASGRVALDVQGKAGEHALKTVRFAMQKLARVFKPKELAHDAYRLYEQFRPTLPVHNPRRTQVEPGTATSGAFTMREMLRFRPLSAKTSSGLP